ncbi:PAS and ANTAR domain-containing protein [Arthrobacter sp. Hor0625]|uniref:PAS and ANTAR domain-containing protein n=1 Tax=Arthrobacter sp. Hor0625 TaxID=3457358 RepID=UPI00403E7A26
MDWLARPLYASRPGPGDLVAGSFVMDGRTKIMEWSDEMYAIHGYRRGEVVPRLSLTLAHKHPDDLARILKVNEELLSRGGHVAIYHRVIDAQSHENKVLTAGEAFLDGAGDLRAVAGVMLDLTSTVHEETAAAARDAIRGAMGTRCLIAKAQGILMGRVAVTSSEAFGILREYSNNSNIKLADVASTLVTLAERPRDLASLDCFLRSLCGGTQKVVPSPTRP